MIKKLKLYKYEGRVYILTTIIIIKVVTYDMRDMIKERLQHGRIKKDMACGRVWAGSGSAKCSRSPALVKLIVS